jgi:hypothetical protein
LRIEKGSKRELLVKLGGALGYQGQKGIFLYGFPVIKVSQGNAYLAESPGEEKERWRFLGLREGFGDGAGQLIFIPIFE